MQPTLFTATYSASRAAETPRLAAAQVRSSRKKHAAPVAFAAAIAGWFRSTRSMTKPRAL